MALEAIVNREGVFRVVLEEQPEGVYVYVFDTPENPWPYRDHLQNDWPMAKHAASEDYETTEDMWTEIPDTHIHG
ncbi:MAG: hypothetical protein FWE88_06365 [Phycisphaerae bacterium]|nr:hypothetical protein [Phycisphaerae bacterium]